MAAPRRQASAKVECYGNGSQSSCGYEDCENCFPEENKDCDCACDNPVYLVQKIGNGKQFQDINPNVQKGYYKDPRRSQPENYYGQSRRAPEYQTGQRQRAVQYPAAQYNRQPVKYSQQAVQHPAAQYGPIRQPARYSQPYAVKETRVTTEYQEVVHQRTTTTTAVRARRVDTQWNYY